MPSWMEAAATSHAVGTWLFLRALGLVYACAFASLAVQVRGLVGSSGILPARDLLRRGTDLGPRRFLELPTLSWLGASDRSLVAQCWAGASAGALVAIGVAPAPLLATCWALYLSQLSVCREFLGYQWDVLLLEAGFLAIFLAPLRLTPEWPPSSAPPLLALGLAWWLLFRLMFSSGAVKLLSGDPSWRKLTALRVHQETQPLPSPLAWHAHQLPAKVHVASAAAMFAVELGAPWLLLVPGWPREVAAASFAALMLLIMATGNYAFFNLLTIALCLLVVPDERWRSFGLPSGVPAPAGWPAAVVVPVTVVLAVLSIEAMVRTLRLRVRWPRALTRLSHALEPFRLVNGYGLFAVMTPSRPELVVEGSDDGVSWAPYEFRWMASDPARRPRWCAPHQPRLDWQAWFAALTSFRRAPWVAAFLARLLQGSPAVLSLLRTNPFPDRPPRMVRVQLWDYSFTDRATRQATGAWWRRRLLGAYSPVLAAPPRDDAS